MVTDSSLLWRILHNMVLNALEASHGGKPVKVWYDREGAELSFKVWNEGVIAPRVANRIFERNFSTKQGDGRGLGTFSMKYFGESILGGRVAFTSEPSLGTTFSFTAPLG